MSATATIANSAGKSNVSPRIPRPAVAKVRQPIESFFAWVQEKTQVQLASKVRSEAGLLVHVFGKIAAALYPLLHANP
jgi:hypothetical protein